MAEFKEELKMWQRKRNCKRRGVLCGHRRSLSGNSMWSCCFYLLDTGKKRGCPPGKKCKHFTEKKFEELPINPF